MSGFSQKYSLADRTDSDPDLLLGNDLRSKERLLGTWISRDAVTARLPPFQTPVHDELSRTPTRYSTAGSDGTQTPTRYSTAGSIKQFTSDLEFAQNLMIFHYKGKLTHPSFENRSENP
jgi:hypothetical protein